MLSLNSHVSARLRVLTAEARYVSYKFLCSVQVHCLFFFFLVLISFGFVYCSKQSFFGTIILLNYFGMFSYNCEIAVF